MCHSLETKENMESENAPLRSLFIDYNSDIPFYMQIKVDWALHLYSEIRPFIRHQSAVSDTWRKDGEMGCLLIDAMKDSLFPSFTWLVDGDARESEQTLFERYSCFWIDRHLFPCIQLNCRKKGEGQDAYETHFWKILSPENRHSEKPLFPCLQLTSWMERGGDGMLTSPYTRLTKSLAGGQGQW